ncbi:MAG: glycosyltransferase family 4 protein [Peptococcaceae bacterium]|nr:glycosyltransferase family 4 protein [Candidatus Syntrophopropionicum ammoniitolerans]
MVFIKILYISDGIFPYGSAYASRLVNFARLFHEIGIDVHIIADFTYNKDLIDNFGQGFFEKSTFEIIGNNESMEERIKRPIICLSKVKAFLDSNFIDIVVMKSISDRFKILYSEIKKRKIPLILESCEWYHYSGYRGGRFNPWYVQFQKCWKHEFMKADGFITISRLLENHYKQYSQNVIRIPTILDTTSTIYNLTNDNKRIKLIYAGNPGKTKEMVANIIIALSLLRENNKRLSLDIYGPNRADIAKQLQKNDYLLEIMKDIVHIHGKIPQEQINEKYMQSDYGIFLREDSKKNHAGFPTKLAESMVAGTPVIANNTGDIALYLKDKKNGFLLKDSSPVEVEKVLRAIIDMDEKEEQDMRLYARRTAEENFDYRRYSGLMTAFLEEVLRNK